jgi:hypothetical protein
LTKLVSYRRLIRLRLCALKDFLGVGTTIMRKLCHNLLGRLATVQAVNGRIDPRLKSDLLLGAVVSIVNARRHVRVGAVNDGVVRLRCANASWLLKLAQGYNAPV